MSGSRGRATTIKVAIGNRGTGEVYRRERIRAVVFGEWAAHRIVGWVSDGWRVTHAPTGLSTGGCADGMTKDDAIAVARALDQRVPTLQVFWPVDDVAHRFDDERYVVVSTIAEVIAEGVAL